MSFFSSQNVQRKTYLDVAKEGTTPRHKPLDLPTEIYFEVAKYCSISTLKKYCRTCRRINGLLTPIFYEDLDLSLHDPVDDTERTSILTKRIYLDNRSSQRERQEHMSYTFFSYPLAARKRRQQDACIQMIMVYPEYAKCVRSFKWTFLTQGDNVDRLPQPSRDKEYRLWHIISLMTNIENVDISHGPLDEVDNFADTLPAGSPLFPSAKSIRLVGVMDDRLATAVLHSSILNNVKRLCLDHLMETRAFPGTTVPIGTLDRQHHSGRETKNIVYPMPSLFTTITGRCAALKVFIWRRLWHIVATWAGVGTEDQKTVRREYNYGNDVDGMIFVQSVRPTLQQLVIDRQWQWEEDPTFEVLAVDPLYSPLVLESWPCLKALHVRIWVLETIVPSPFPFPLIKCRNMIMQLRRSLGPDVNVILSADLTPEPWDQACAFIHAEEERRLRSGAGSRLLDGGLEIHLPESTFDIMSPPTY